MYCDIAGANEGIKSSSWLVVHDRHESSSVVLRSHSSRSRRQQILKRHGRKYEHCCFSTSVCAFFTIAESNSMRSTSRSSVIGTVTGNICTAWSLTKFCHWCTRDNFGEGHWGTGSKNVPCHSYKCIAFCTKRNKSVKDVDIQWQKRELSRWSTWHLWGRTLGHRQQKCSVSHLRIHCFFVDNRWQKDRKLMSRWNSFSCARVLVDARLPMFLDNTLRSVVSIVFSVALIAALLPWSLLSLPVVGAAYALVYVVFRVGIRRLQRYQLESMAPLLTHVDASVYGLSSVHAYQRVDEF